VSPGRFANPEVRAELERSLQKSRSVSRRNRRAASRTGAEKSKRKKKKKREERPRKKTSDNNLSEKPKSTESKPAEEAKQEEPTKIETKNEPEILDRNFEDDSDELGFTITTNIVNISNIKYETYRRLLEYVYCGHFDMLPDNAFELMPIAYEYQLDHLKSLCAVKIQSAIDVSNVLQALTLADQCKTTELKQTCLAFIGDNRKEVSPALKNGSLHPDLLKEVKKWLTVQSLDKLQTSTVPIYQTIIT
jgi:DNA mismatch repair ATPase MutL